MSDKIKRAKQNEVHITAAPGYKMRAYRKVKEGEADLIFSRLSHRLHSMDITYAAFLTFSLVVLLFASFIHTSPAREVIYIGCIILLITCIAGLVKDRSLRDLFFFGNYHVMDVYAYEVLPGWSSDGLRGIRVYDKDGHYLWQPLEVEKEAAWRVRENPEETFLLVKYYYHGKSRFLCFSPDPELDAVKKRKFWGREKERKLQTE